MESFLIGIGTGLALIAAIGAQNAFVLRRGLRGEYVPMIVAICAGSDAVLICLGVSGIGSVVRMWPAAITVITWFGAAFLLGYGVLAARRALNPDSMTVESGSGGRSTVRAVALTCLALTWLNPHVYLDTMLLLGSAANSYGPQRWLFAAGAVLASVLWFAALGFGARLFSGLFTRRSAWRVLDGLVAGTMATLGVTMLLSA